jgi:LPXTG-motif cell wall-anchored protein
MRRSSRIGGIATVIGLVAVVAGLSMAPAGAAQAPVALGSAASYGVLGGSTVTNTGSSVIEGDVGVSPGTAITGFPPGTATGTMHANDTAAANAQSALTTAYNDAAGRATTSTIAADLGGQTLVPGVYAGGAIGLTGTLTLDGGGDPTATFIFKAASSLVTASSSSVALIGGATACNVFWQVTSSATLGTGSSFVGSILALTSITANTGASITGRLLARNGAVTLDTNTVRRPSCAAPASSTSSTSSSTSTSTSSSTTSTTSTTAPTTTSTTVTSTTPTTSVATSSAGPPTTIASSTPSTAPAGSSSSATTVVTSGSGTELPRTGATSDVLALVGLLTIALGITLVLGSRRTSS